MGDTVLTMKNTLSKYLEQYKNLKNDNDLLLKEANAKTWEFTSERAAGMKGNLPSYLFPTLQDLTIYMFYGSIITLFTIMGSTSSILAVKTDKGISNIPQYVFITGLITAFITSFYSAKLTFLLVIVIIIYFITVSYKALIFFIVFLLIISLTTIMVNSTM